MFRNFHCFAGMLAALASVAIASPIEAQTMTTPQAVTTDATVTSSVAKARSTSADSSIRPFHVHVSDAALMDLKRRVNATRWPDKETVADQSQGAQLARLQQLMKYWGTGYDWRKAEAQLNALPQFMTNIDGLDIHFIQVKSKEKNAMPLLITHGWPGSVFEFLGTIGPLTDPVAHGGTAADAFDVVIPSIPGYGFSGKPTAPGWGPEHVAQVWTKLMRRLGYTRYVAQGGDWGAVITTELARQAPPGLLGVHLNLPAAIPPEVAAALATPPAHPRRRDSPIRSARRLKGRGNTP